MKKRSISLEKVKALIGKCVEVEWWDEEHGHGGTWGQLHKIADLGSGIELFIDNDRVLLGIIIKVKVKKNARH